jgi:hypothetical protein
LGGHDYATDVDFAERVGGFHGHGEDEGVEREVMVECWRAFSSGVIE